MVSGAAGQAWSGLRFERPARPTASIVIPVHNQHRHTWECLRSLAAAADTRGCEVIVVDDGSHDQTRAMLDAVEGIRTLRFDRNRGFVEACNLGGGAARADRIVFLNNDTLVADGWLRPLVETHEQEPGAGVVGAKLVYPDGRLQEAGGIVWRDGSAWNYGRGDDPDQPEYSYARDVDYCSGACLLVDRALFWRLGGFDRYYSPAYYEDVDLCFRARAAGRRVIYQPAARVVHLEGGTGGTDPAAGAKRFQAINQARLVERWADVLRAHREPGVDPALEKERGVQKRALVVDDRVLAPDRDAGSARMWKLIEVLQGLSFKVTFAAAGLGRVEPYVQRLQRRGVEVLYAPFVTSVVEHLRGAGAHYDLVLLSRPDVGAAYADAVRALCPRARLVYDAVDLYFVREGREAELRSDPALQAAAQARKRQEIGVIENADAVLVVSPVDLDVVRREASATPAHVVSDIQDVQGSRRSFADRRDLLFIGGFAHRPNVDAVRYFVECVFPLVRRRLPGVRLHVIGSDPPADVRSLAAEDVNVVGYARDLAPWLADCRVFVAPIRFGSGVRVKVTLSLSHGLPVVATPAAVEGMRLTPERDVLVADAPGAFCSAIARLYEDEKLWTRLSAGGLDTVRRLYSRETARVTLQQVVSPNVPIEIGPAPVE
ncbi:MAG TPA: glycosyltransferase [Vicinamibacteria bacterium]